MSRRTEPIIIKTTKTLPVVITAIYSVLVIVILLRSGIGAHGLWLYGSVLLVTTLLLVLLADSFSGYLELSNDSLTRKNLFGSNTIEISEIKEVSKARHIFGPDQIDLGNAQNKVSIVQGAFKQAEFALLVEQLCTELEAVNPKHAKALEWIIGKRDLLA